MLLSLALTTKANGPESPCIRWEESSRPFPAPPELSTTRKPKSCKALRTSGRYCASWSVRRKWCAYLFLPPEGHIKDHFDFHTSFQFGLLRLHIPIITHPDVIFIIDGQQVAMNPGELWYGDFSKVHSVKNNSSVVRVHMVVDVQINDFVLSLFPEDFIARRRAEGISITTEPIPASEAELRRFACDFRIPGEFMPMFVIGKPLSVLAKGGSASVRLIDGKLNVLIDNEPAFRLERLADDVFGISGLPPGMTLQLKRENQVVNEVLLHMKGLPKDLYSARLGIMRGPMIMEQSVSLPVIQQTVNAAGSLS